jgi:hypothetical protein
MPNGHEHDHAHDHAHDHDHGESTYGMVLGFRLVEREGSYFLVEAEVGPYVDEPSELGATLVFHPLDGLDPTAADVEHDLPALPVDIDDDLTRDPAEPIPGQFQAIVRQLAGLSDAKLLEYLDQAGEE